MDASRVYLPYSLLFFVLDKTVNAFSLYIICYCTNSCFALVFYIDRRSATPLRGQVKYQRFEYELIDSQNLSTSQTLSFLP